MKPASDKQIIFAHRIHSATGKPLPQEKSASAYFIYIHDNIEEYNTIQARRRAAYHSFLRKYKAEQHIYNSHLDEEQDAAWAAAMDFSWM